MKGRLFGAVILLLLCSATVMAKCDVTLYGVPGSETDNKNPNSLCYDHEQGRKGKFDPQKYQRDLECFIVNEAHLTPQEAQAFFPVFREMLAKMRAIYMKQKKISKAMFTDNNVAMEAIRNKDALEIEIKKLQQHYHNRFLKVLPATKVLICIHAEERFNRDMMRKMTKH